MSPDYSHEARYRARGLGPVAGVDEAGRGPLAGPVVVAASILDPDDHPHGLNDSKKLTAAKREQLFDEILNSSQCAIISLSAAEIDRSLSCFFYLRFNLCVTQRQCRICCEAYTVQSATFH